MSILDYFKTKNKDKECPQCAKAQKHVRLVETEGQVECPECKYFERVRH
jgi:hypothetical protein